MVGATDHEYQSFSAPWPVTFYLAKTNVAESLVVGGQYLQGLRSRRLFILSDLDFQKRYLSSVPAIAYTIFPVYIDELQTRAGSRTAG